MRISTFTSALLLAAASYVSAEPAAAAADAELSTTTCTSTSTLYKTITLQRVVATTTATWHNATTSYQATGTGSFRVSATHAATTSDSAPIASATTSGAGAVRNAVGAVAGVAAMAAVFLL